MTTETHHSVLIHLLGKEYPIACTPEQQESLLQAAQHLDSQMREIRESGKVIGLERIAVMAALNLAHDLLETQHQSHTTLSDTDNSLSRVDQKLDNALQRLRQLEI